MAPTRKAAQKAKVALKQQQEVQVEFDDEGEVEVESPGEDDSEDSESAEEAPPKKRKQSKSGMGAAGPSVSGGGAQGKRGKGKGKGKGKGVGIPIGTATYFEKMPVDILYEVASHLDPLSLANLGFTSHLFYSIICNKSSSKALWVASRRTCGLPDIEATDMTEAAYAKLVFDKTCHVCGKENATKVIYSLRVRACHKKCLQENVMSEKGIYKELDGILHRHTLECSRRTDKSPTYTKTTCYFLPEVRAVQKTLIQLEKENEEIYEEWKEAKMKLMEEEGKGKGGKKKKGKGREKGEEKELDWFAFVRDKEREKTRYEVYVQERKERAQVSFRDGKKIEKCEKDFLKSVRDDKTALFNVRRDFIYAKLEELGHDSRDFPRSGAAFELDELTDDAWDRIRPGVLRQVRSNNTARLNVEAQHRRRTRLDALRPYYDAFDTEFAVQLEYLNPHFELWAKMTELEPFWQAEDSFMDDIKWQTVKPTLVPRVAEMSAERKRKSFVHLVDTYFVAKRPVNFGLVKKVIDWTLVADAKEAGDTTIGVAEGDLADEDPVPFSIDRFTTEASRAVLTDDDMAPLFDSFLSKIQCFCQSPACRITVHSYLPFKQHIHTVYTGQNRESLHFNLKWIHSVGGLLDSAGVSVDGASEEDLDALGRRILCVSCVEEAKETMWVPKNPVMDWPLAKTHLLRHEHSFQSTSRALGPKLRLLESDKEVEKADADFQKATREWDEENGWDSDWDFY